MSTAPPTAPPAVPAPADAAPTAGPPAAATAVPGSTPPPTPPAAAATVAPTPPSAPPVPPAPHSTNVAAPLPTQSFHSASLYIGDLLPDVNEGLLYEIFNAVGPVASIRVCRDAVTRRSLGYAYVNYHQASDAERALESMNFTDIRGKPCRIMWSQRDPSVRRSGVGNIFVKNLHEGIDHKQLYDTFSLFGNILSCKVVTDRETGLSKGYGYVHYETQAAADSAIEKLDGMLIDGREVQVGAFMRKEGRPDGTAFTNVFVKNLPYAWDEDKLREEFGAFGEIVSASVSQGRRKRFPKKAAKAPEKGEDEEKGEKKEEGEKEEEAIKETKEEDTPRIVSPDLKEDAPDVDALDEDAPKSAEGKPKPMPEGPTAAEPSESESLGFGFVNFLNDESAAAAVKAMNEKEYEVDEDGERKTKILFVGRAQKKAERERELRTKYEAEKSERIAKFQGVNLYVKNLGDAVDDDELRREFAGLGTITSARVMRDHRTGTSRGFGFVCFASPEDSTRAVNEMNGKIVGGKPIFVALAQRRDVRRAQLEAQHGQRGGVGGPGGGPGHPGAAGMLRGLPAGYPGAVPMYMPGPGRAPGAGGPHVPGGPYAPHIPGMGGRGAAGYHHPGAPRGPYHQGGPGGYALAPVMPGRGGRGVPGAGRGRGPIPGRQGVPYGRGAPGRGPVPRGPGGPRPGPGGPVALPRGDAGRGLGVGAALGPPGGALPVAAGQLTPAALASASPEVQKNMIGERLYPLIHRTQPELAGKITGMLLEMDNSELLHLLESPEALGAKIHEALQVLEAHNAGGDK